MGCCVSSEMELITQGVCVGSSMVFFEQCWGDETSGFSD